MARYTEETARAAVADFLGCEVQEVGFSMASTQNSYNLALNLSKTFKPGDELIITEIDHRCNSAPWMSLKRLGCVVKCGWILSPSSWTLRTSSPSCPTRRRSLP